jgi:hypothetical protein
MPKKPKNPAICPHCRRRRRLFRRGLCWSCYDDRSIRRRYPRQGGRGKKYYDHNDGRGRRGRLPKEPTCYLPGTPEREKVLALRAERGESLFHPDDPKLDRTDRPPIAELLPAGIEAQHLPVRLPPRRRLAS